MKKPIKNIGPAARSVRNIEAATLDETCMVFQVTGESLRNWARQGCPRNNDGTYSLYEVYKYRVERNKGKTLKDAKTQAEINLLESKLEKANDLYMLRADHDNMMASWASSFRKFWDQAVRKNVHHFAMKEIDQLNVMFYEFGRQLMEVWAGAFSEAGKPTPPPAKKAAPKAPVADAGHTGAQEPTA